MTKTTLATLACLGGYGIFGVSCLASSVALAQAAPLVVLTVRFLTAFIALNLIVILFRIPMGFRGKPMGRLQYTAGALAPTLVLGILPGVCGVLCGSAWWLMLGVVMTLAGGGDLTILLKLWRHRPAGRQVLYLDHPWQAGLVAFER